LLAALEDDTQPSCRRIQHPRDLAQVCRLALEKLHATGVRAGGLIARTHARFELGIIVPQEHPGESHCQTPAALPGSAKRLEIDAPSFELTASWRIWRALRELTKFALDYFVQAGMSNGHGFVSKGCG
jgi:hypothetical protein